MKKLLSIIFASAFYLLFTQHALAWFGAGNGGWPNAYDGLTGSVLSSYQAAPATYTTGQAIPLSVSLANPTGNTTISKSIYLKIFKITHSPQSLDLNYPQASTNYVISETELYNNNKAGNDFQEQYQATGLGNIYLPSGQKTTINTSFSITDPGYYQFDVTDLPNGASYIPGHIYAAGFVRVIPSTNNNNNNTNTNNSNTVNTSNTVCTDSKPNTPSNLEVGTVTNGQVTLSWSNPTGAYTYLLVAYSDNPAAPKWGNPNVGNVTSYTVSGLGSGTYYFWVRAQNGCTPGDFTGPVSTAITSTNPQGAIAQGFNTGVLGSSTTTNTPHTQTVLGSKTSVSACNNTCKYSWQLLALEIVLFFLAGFFLKFKTSRRIIFGLIPVGVFILFALLNRQCMSYFVLNTSSSLLCKFFWLADIIIALIYVLGRKKFSTSK